MQEQLMKATLLVIGLIVGIYIIGLVIEKLRK